MVTVEFEKQCGCFKRSDYEAVKSFNTLEEAQKDAETTCKKINEEFCLKHNFEALRVSDDKIVIKMYLSE